MLGFHVTLKLQLNDMSLKIEINCNYCHFGHANSLKKSKRCCYSCTASCILMLWNYSSALQRCKCPICSSLISKLTPEASLTLRQEKEIVEALKKLQRYNRLFVGGARGFIMVSLYYNLFIECVLRLSEQANFLDFHYVIFWPANFFFRLKN